MINLEQYFKRIGYNGSTALNADTLRELHRAHLYSVPFENLDIHLDRPISIALADIYDKIVVRKRGGFCYEQNGLFAAVLRQMGFKVDILEALPSEDSIRWDHMTLLVHLEQRWLTDVGFGENFIEPLLIDEIGAQQQGDKAYRIEHDGQEGRYYSLKDGAWQVEFRFDFTPHTIEAFIPGCTFHQTSPDSHFTRKRVCSLATPNGRITVSGSRFIETINGQRTETELENETAVEDVLNSRFNIDLAR